MIIEYFTFDYLPKTVAIVTIVRIFNICSVWKDRFGKQERESNPFTRSDEARDRNKGKYNVVQY